MSNDDVVDSGYSSCLGINNRLLGDVLFTPYGITLLIIVSLLIPIELCHFHQTSKQIAIIENTPFQLQCVSCREV